MADQLLGSPISPSAELAAGDNFGEMRTAIDQRDGKTLQLWGFNLRLSAPDSLITVEDYRQRARRRLPRMVWHYVDGGADGMETISDNQKAFGKWSLRSRVLSGAGDPDLRTSVADTLIDLPVLLAPTGFLGLSHWRGDIEAARAATSRGTRFVVSTASSWSIEDIAEAAPGHFFQLYPWEGEFGSELMKRAWGAGYRTLMVTVDVPVVGNRQGERKNGMGMPPTMFPRNAFNIMRYPRWAWNAVRHQRIGGRNLVDSSGFAAAVKSAEIQMRQMRQSDLTWDDFGWMRDQWKGKLFIKGVLEPEDAVRAVELGADGVVVSNHGGRQLNFARATLDALPDVVAAVGQRSEVLLDGGVRRGTDVIKALALGARAVMIGRPYIYGVAAAGEKGVQGVLDIFRAEISRSLSLMGCQDVASLDRSWLAPRDSPDAALTRDARMNR